MKYVTLGKTGLKVSKICLGAMTFGYTNDETESRILIQKALDYGINFIDTANIYSRGRSEEILGNAIRDRRQELIIASKVFWSFRHPEASGLSREFVLEELDGSLQRLQTSYIDLYYAHRYDPHTPVEEFLQTFNQAIEAGKIRHIGASTMHSWELVKSLWMADKLHLQPIRVIQPQYNLLYREEEREMLPLCLDQGIAVAPWAPLAQGVLTGRYTREKLADTPRSSGRDIQHWFLREIDFKIIDRVVEVARQKKVSPAQVALAWVFSKDAITAPIIGVSRLEHLVQAVEALDIELTPEESRDLEELYQPRDLIGHFAGVPMAGDFKE